MRPPAPGFENSGPGGVTGTAMAGLTRAAKRPEIFSYLGLMYSHNDQSNALIVLIPICWGLTRNPPTP